MKIMTFLINTNNIFCSFFIIFWKGHLCNFYLTTLAAYFLIWFCQNTINKQVIKATSCFALSLYVMGSALSIYNKS